MQTYREPIGRFVVEKLEDYAGLPEHRAALIERGIQPEDNWLLEWSFTDKQKADECALDLMLDDRLSRRRRVRDRGADAPLYIERPVY